MRNISDKSCRENHKTHFVFSNFFLNRAVYEMVWKNIVERGRPEMTMWRLRIPCWIPKATNTHSEYVIPFFHCNNGSTNAHRCYVIVHCLSGSFSCWTSCGKPDSDLGTQAACCPRRSLSSFLIVTPDICILLLYCASS